VALDKFNAPQIGSSVSAWLPFLFYSMLSLTLMLVDSRFALSSAIRSQTSVLASPVWWLASRPFALWQDGASAFTTNARLRRRVAELEAGQLKSDLALQQTATLQSENDALRALLRARQRAAIEARLVELVNVNPDPSQKRFVIDKGAAQKVHVGQVLIDAHGLVGQVAEVYPGKSLVISITDADHALPVMVARSGFRSILFGQGNDRRLSLANLTPSDDIKAGDVLLTSGIGGRFPAGIPVGVVKQFKQDEALTFLSAQVQPFARLAYGRQLLLLDFVEGRPQRPIVPIQSEAKPNQTPAVPAPGAVSPAQPPAVKPTLSPGPPATSSGQPAQAAAADAEPKP
jgi:rod shape-determining protein MreC